MILQKNIHQIWLGEYQIPKREIRFIEKIKTQLKDYNYFFWDNNNLPKMPEKLQDAFDFYKSNRKFMQMSVILRYYLVYEYGGIYLDVDYELNGMGLPEYIQNSNSFIIIPNERMRDITNSFFGFYKHHPLMSHIIEKINIKERDWHGQSWFTQTIKREIGLGLDCTANEMFEKCKIYGVDCFNLDLMKENYLQHHLLYSWHPQNIERFEKGDINYAENK